MSTERAKIERIVQNYRIETLKKIINVNDDHWNTIMSINITSGCDEKNPHLSIVYEHHTDMYNLNDYCFNDESESEESVSISKNTILECGYISGKFYICGKTPIKVYSKRNSSRRPIVYSTTYEHEIDEINQTILMQEYADNKNVPEWLIISFFNVLKTSDIDIEFLISELSFA